MILPTQDQKAAMLNRFSLLRRGAEIVAQQAFSRTITGSVSASTNRTPDNISYRNQHGAVKALMYLKVTMLRTLPL